MSGNRNKFIFNFWNRILTNAVSNPVRTETSAWCFYVHMVGRQNWISEKEPKLKQGTKNVTNSGSSKLTQREVTNMQRRHTQRTTGWPLNYKICRNTN